MESVSGSIYQDSSLSNYEFEFRKPCEKNVVVKKVSLKSFEGRPLLIVNILPVNAIREKDLPTLGDLKNLGVQKQKSKFEKSATWDGSLRDSQAQSRKAGVMDASKQTKLRGTFHRVASLALVAASKTGGKGEPPTGTFANTNTFSPSGDLSRIEKKSTRSDKGRGKTGVILKMKGNGKGQGKRKGRPKTKGQKKGEMFSEGKHSKAGDDYEARSAKRAVVTKTFDGSRDSPGGTTGLEKSPKSTKGDKGLAVILLPSVCFQSRARALAGKTDLHVDEVVAGVLDASHVFVSNAHLKLRGANRDVLVRFLCDSATDEGGKCVCCSYLGRGELKGVYTKFLVNRQGMVVSRYGPEVSIASIRHEILKI